MWPTGRLIRFTALPRTPRHPPCLFPPCFSCRLQTLSRGQGQRCDPVQYGSEELPCDMTLRQQQPVIPGVPYQPSARLHQPLLQTCQRPVPDFLWQYQPPPKVPQVIGDHSPTAFFRLDANLRELAGAAAQALLPVPFHLHSREWPCYARVADAGGVEQIQSGSR